MPQKHLFLFFLKLHRVACRQKKETAETSTKASNGKGGERTKYQLQDNL